MLKPMPPTVSELEAALATLEKFAAAGGTCPDPALQEEAPPPPPPEGRRP